MQTRGKKMDGRTSPPGLRWLLSAAAAGLCLAGCTREGKFQPVSMWNESRLKAMEASPVPGAPSVARSPVPGTVARGQLDPTDPVMTGRSGGRLLTTSPVRVTPAVVQRGQERYNVFCAPCHGRLGDGEGLIVKRSFPPPPDYAIARLKNAPVGHFFDVMTNGYGVMYSYAERVSPRDRWAIAAYIRVIQRTRPTVPETRQEERLRARERAIVDPSRGMHLPDEGGAPRREPDAHTPPGNVPTGNMPGGTPPAGPTAPESHAPLQNGPGH